MKKILIFSHEFPPFVGGVGSVGEQLSKWLSKDYKVTVVTRRQANIRPIVGVDIIQVDILHKLWFLSYAKFFIKHKLEQYDSIILNECAPTITAGMFFSDSILSKCIVYVHGLEVENLYNITSDNLKRKFFGFSKFHRKACLKSKKIIAVGQHMKSKFCHGSRISEDLVDVIYVGLDTSQFSILERGDDKVFNIVSTSRIVKEKGYCEKLEIISKLISSNNKIYWHICGTGDYLDILKNDVKELHLESNVYFHGYCDRNRLKKIYKDCDVFLLLSNYDEALPLSYIEAQLCGVPSIGYNVGGTKEAILNYKNGILVDNKDEVYKVINDLYFKRISFYSDEVRLSSLYFDMDKTLLKLKGVIDGK